MKRSPLRRKSGLRGNGTLRRSKLNPVSSKRRRQLSEYAKVRSAYLKLNPVCVCCATHPSTEIHHRKGRWKERLNDSIWFAALCRNCHDYIHANAEWAYEKGWLIHR